MFCLNALAKFGKKVPFGECGRSCCGQASPKKKKVKVRNLSMFGKGTPVGKGKERCHGLGKGKSRKAMGGSGAMSGAQIFDLAEVSRLCQPVRFTNDTQFSPHSRAFSMFASPGKILHTDDTSCALDAFNMATALRDPITRSELEGDCMCLTATAPQVASALGEAPSLLSSPSNGVSVGGAVECMPVNLGRDRMVKAMKRRGCVLEAIGPKDRLPKLQTVLKQNSGVFLVEFHWMNGTDKNHHVIAVNCDLRYVYCNTLGAIPFSLAKEEGKFLARESEETHERVAKLFRVQSITRVWRILRAKPA